MWADVYIATAATSTIVALGVTAPEGELPRESSRFLPKRPVIACVLATIVGMILIAVAAARWHVGADYWDYERGFTRRVATPLSSLGVFDEPGLYIVAKFAAMIRNDPAIMFGLVSAATIGLIVWTFYRSTQAFAMAILLFVITSNWQGTFNGIRQFVAVAILFAGHSFIINRHPKRWLLVVLLATLFHVSALIMFALYWMPRRRLTVMQIVLLLTISLIGLNAYGLFASLGDEVRGTGYVSGGYFVESISPLRIAVALAPIIIFALLTNKDALQPREFFYINVMFLNFALLLIALNSAYLARYAMYTGIYACIGIPALINMDRKSMRDLLYLATVAFYIVFWYYDTVANPNLLDFRTLWDRPMMSIVNP